MAKAAPDITGQKFALLTAIKMVGRNKRGNALWECVCDCGGMITVQAAYLKMPHVHSCGCMSRKRHYSKNFKHGMTETPEFRTWKAMIERCTSPAHKAFHRWGGRGITVCAEWLNSFETFYADMGPRPVGPVRYTLDRRDNDKGYSKANCRWATYTEQQRNKANVRMLTHNGETLSLPEWAERMDLPNPLLSRRILNGWSVHDALTTRPVPRSERASYRRS